jgi:hypothetical protein
MSCLNFLSVTPLPLETVKFGPEALRPIIPDGLPFRGASEKSSYLFQHLHAIQRVLKLGKIRNQMPLFAISIMSDTNHKPPPTYHYETQLAL